MKMDIMIKEILSSKDFYFYSDGNELYISGIALGEGQWKNNEYTADGLSKSYESLIGKPLLYEHGLDPVFQDLVIGNVISAWYDKDFRAIAFLAKVTCNRCKDMLRSGELKAVSVSVQPVMDRYEFDELSLVHAPACDVCHVLNIREKLSKTIKEEYKLVEEILVWDETEEYIRHRVADPDRFDPDSMRTIDLDKERGIKAVVGCPKGNYEGGRCKVGMEQQNVMFAKDHGWTMTKAKEWWDSHKSIDTPQSLAREILSEDERKELNDLRKLKEIVEKTPETKVLSELVMQKNKEIEDNKAKIADLEKTKTALEAEKAKIPSLEAKITEQDKSIKDSVDLIAKMKQDQEQAIKTAVKESKEEDARKIGEILPPDRILKQWKSLGAMRLTQDIKKKLREMNKQ